MSTAALPTSAVSMPDPSSPPAHETRETSAGRDVLLLIATASILRIVLGAVIGLGVDESYALAATGVGRAPLSLSYFDHPPLAFWIAGLTARVGTAGGHLLPRLPFIGLFAGTTWLVYRLAATLFSERAGWYAAVTLSLAPVFSVSTGSWILPDGPLMFGESLAALALAQIVFRSPRRPSLWWAAFATGACVALLSKYHAVLFLAGVLLWSLTSARPRAWLRRREPYIALLVACMGALPVLVWNARHDWVSLHFQLSRASQGGAAGAHVMVPLRVRVGALLQNIGGQIGYLLPWIWVPMVWQLWQAIRRGPGARNERQWFCACLAVIPILLFTAASLGGRAGLPHWPAPGYLFAVPLVGAWLASVERRLGRTLLRRVVTGAAIGLLAPIALIASQASTGWMSMAMPSLFRHGDPSLDLLDWRGLREQLLARGLLAGNRPVFATHWIDAAKLAYGLGPSTPVRCLGDDPRHFQFLPPVGNRPDTLVIVRSDSSGMSVSALHRTAPYLGPMVSLGVFPIRRAGRPAVYVTAFISQDAGLHH